MRRRLHRKCLLALSLFHGSILPFMKHELNDLLWLSHEIGREERQLAILSEGNTSAKLTNETFAVKASGSCLATLTESDLTLCDTAKVLAILEKRQLADAE